MNGNHHHTPVVIFENVLTHRNAAPAHVQSRRGTAVGREPALTSSTMRLRRNSSILRLAYFGLASNRFVLSSRCSCTMPGMNASGASTFQSALGTDIRALRV